MKYQVLIKNPVEQVALPRRKQGKRTKPYVTPQQFEMLIRHIPADVKDAQAQMRHSRASTTLDLYQQFVAERQVEVVAGSAP